MKQNTRKKKIISVVIKWLLLAVSTACILSIVFTYLVLYDRSENDVYKLLDQNSHDLIKDVLDKMNEDILGQADKYKEKIPTANMTDPEKITEYLESHTDKETEVSVVDEEGTITASSERSACGENVLKNNNENFWGAKDIFGDFPEEKKTAKEFGISSGLWIYNEDKQFKSLDGKRDLYYFGSSFDDWSGLILYGITESKYDERCYVQSGNIVFNRHIGREGYFLIVKKSKMLIVGGTGRDIIGEKFPYPELISDMVDAGREDVVHDQEEDTYEDEKMTRGRADFYGVPSYYSISGIKDNMAIAIYPESEALESLDRTLRITLIMEIVVFLVLFIVILLFEKKIVINDIHRVNATLNSITQGDLEAKADVRRTYEFDALSTDINTTVDRLKQFIKEAEQRIDEELALAAKIQSSFIPHEFPPFPDRDEFELYASMIPAKEVGGDFYDYFFVDEDHLAMVMADVSGKGIPAAMFMVMTKDELRHAVMKHGTDVAEAVREVNLELIKENDAGLFVTVWLGVLTVSTGHVDYVNAGHEYPAISHAGGEFVAEEDEHSIPMAARKKAKFDAGSFDLSPGDILYLYTDGVTEANNADEEMFRRSRMLDALNSDREAAVQDIDDNVRKAVADFVQDAPQFDDTTTLCLRYKGK
ncbi:MAG: SpoIIE family protein phosphatase [Eubacterium sp.]|nr:SpoIIE family protein phosphatase [Eubacterium sp.]